MRRRRRISLLGVTVGLALAALGCRDAPRRPSFLLFVMDTTRADAVSAYGSVAGTTPTVDGLAREGLLYRHAYAQAPWTLPSHTTLFTGLAPVRHGVGWHHTRAADALVTLAERLRDAGYQTFGFSENMWVSEYFNLAQGFERFVLNPTWGRTGPSATEALANWLSTLRPDRPFFVFVNVIDPHAPYSLRPRNPFLRDEALVQRAATLSQRPQDYLCVSGVSRRDLAILSALYLGDVAAADAKLARVLSLLRGADRGEGLVTIVTADHGEHFGEHRLVSHQFSLHEALLHVPLVVHGVPNVRPAALSAPVALEDVVPSVLRWAELPAAPELPGPPLPTAVQSPVPDRAFLAEFHDPERPRDEPEFPVAERLRAYTNALRKHCGAEDRVRGSMRALLHFPWKLIWYERYPPQLYDLRADPQEQHDLSALRADERERLLAELENLRGAAPPPPRESEHPLELPPAVVEQLRALGYIGPAPEAPASPPSAAPAPPARRSKTR